VGAANKTATPGFRGLGGIKPKGRQAYLVSYNTNYLSEKLRKSGWSLQQPARAPREREEALVRQRLQEHWPRIKKGPSGAKQ